MERELFSIFFISETKRDFHLRYSRIMELVLSPSIETSMYYGTKTHTKVFGSVNNVLLLATLRHL